MDGSNPIPMSKKSSSDNMTRQIDENLRRVYKETVEEEIPERFQQLLQKLKEREQSK